MYSVHTVYVFNETFEFNFYLCCIKKELLELVCISFEECMSLKATMKSSLAVTLCSCLVVSVYFFQTGEAKEVKIFDPQTLYRHYKDVWRSTHLNSGRYPVEGLRILF